jgi:pyrimidine deaminase RibD-like protein
MMAEQEISFMELAIQLAAKCPGEKDKITPHVGAVVVLEGKVVSTGFRGEGKPGRHAEYVALEENGKDLLIAGSTVYTTLEPCTERAKEKSPCAKRLIERRVRRVVVGMLDPNQTICGKGVRALRHAGIIVDFFPADLMAQVEEQNRLFTSEQERVSRLTGFSGPAINPFFSEHLRLLDEHFVPETIIKESTIVIVVGYRLGGELLDRFAAGLLRDAINVRGERLGVRSLILSASCWMEPDYAKLKLRAAALSIGAGPGNPFTREVREAAAKENSEPWTMNGSSGIYVANPPRVALWGNTAEDTLGAVQNYIKDPRGVEEFLRILRSG